MDQLTEIRRWVKIYIASANRLLAALFGLCLLVLIGHDILFSGWPELFWGGAKLWTLFYQLCLAFSASYIFYFVTIHGKRQHEKETLRPFLYRHTLYIVGDAQAISRALKEASGYCFAGDFPPKLEDTEGMCQAVNPHNTAPQFMGTWLQYLADRRQRTMENTARIYTAAPFLESEHLQRVMDIENCNYFNQLRWLFIVPPTNQDFSFMASTIHDYFDEAKRLQEYAYSKLTLTGKFEPL